MSELAVLGGKTELIFSLEAILKTLPSITPKVEHYFAEGVYARCFYLPKGVAASSHIHRKPCVTVVPYGKVRTITTLQDAEEVQEVSGFSIFESPAGIKRAIYGVEDTVWITLHPNPENERDPEKLLAKYTITPQELLSKRLENT